MAGRNTAYQFSTVFLEGINTVALKTLYMTVVYFTSTINPKNNSSDSRRKKHIKYRMLRIFFFSNLSPEKKLISQIFSISFKRCSQQIRLAQYICPSADPHSSS